MNPPRRIGALALAALLVAMGACSSSTSGQSAPLGLMDAGSAGSGGVDGGGSDAGQDSGPGGAADSGDEGDGDAANDAASDAGTWGSVCYFYNPGGTAAKPAPGQCGGLPSGPITADAGGCFLSTVVQMGEYVGFCTFSCYDPSADSGAFDPTLVALCASLGGSCDSADGGVFTGDCVPPGGFDDGGL